MAALAMTQLGEQILLGVEAVGGEDGGFERGVGVRQRICAVQFEGAVERAQAALQFRHRLGTAAATIFTTAAADDSVMTGRISGLPLFSFDFEPLCFAPDPHDFSLAAISL